MAVEAKAKHRRVAEAPPTDQAGVGRTVVGWQGIRCLLPPDWNVSTLAMERENGYLRVDAPDGAPLTVQIRWSRADAQPSGSVSVYGMLAPYVRKLMRRRQPAPQSVDLKSNVEALMKESAKQARKARVAFESSIKPEKTEGDRISVNFSWAGAGRGQGKIWHCSVCNRIVVAQVVGERGDQAAIASIASQLFKSLQDHSDDEWELWALYDLQTYIPSSFRLESQKLLTGHLQLRFTRGGERIYLDRWGLANVTLKKFTADEWLCNQAVIGLRRMTKTEETTKPGHGAVRYSGRLGPVQAIRSLGAAKGRLSNIATAYSGLIWNCEQSNRLFVLQILFNGRSESLCAEVVDRCVCHD
jgi:hypothetical protein